MVSLTSLRKLLSYNRGTGLFRWKVRPRLGKVKIGDVAGGAHHQGYIHVTINRRKYLAHRLAWLYVYGEWPQHEIDHLDGNRSNNKIKNLREASDKINSHNRRRHNKNNSIGLLGVYRHRGKFKSMIGVDWKIKYIGVFDTKEEAHKAYLEAKRKLHSGCTL